MKQLNRICLTVCDGIIEKTCCLLTSKVATARRQLATSELQLNAAQRPTCLISIG